MGVSTIKEDLAYNVLKSNFLVNHYFTIFYFYLQYIIKLCIILIHICNNQFVKFMFTNNFTFVCCKAQKMKFQYTIVTRCIGWICENLPKRFIACNSRSFQTISTGFVPHYSAQNCASNHVHYFDFRSLFLLKIRNISKFYSFVLWPYNHELWNFVPIFRNNTPRSIWYVKISYICLKL